jgi:hypothetical protein
MRGIIRNLEQPGLYRAQARSYVTIDGTGYAPGQIFSFEGDPNRLQGLADITLFPSVVQENFDRWDVSYPRFKGLSWLSPFSQSDGYGSLALEAVLGLLKAGIDVAPANMGWVDAYNLPPMIRTRLEQALTMYQVMLLMTPPDDGMVFTRNIMQEQVVDSLFKKQFRILYTMFETDGLPRGWAERINYGADMVFVPSRVPGRFF